MRINVLLACAVLALTVSACRKKPAPPTSGVNPAKKGVPGRAGSATSKSTVAAPQATLPVVAPANACLWWSLYISVFKDKAGSDDAYLLREACDAANFGTEERRNAIVAAWTSAAR